MVCKDNIHSLSCETFQRNISVMKAKSFIPEFITAYFQGRIKTGAENFKLAYHQVDKKSFSEMSLCSPSERNPVRTQANFDLKAHSFAF